MVSIPHARTVRHGATRPPLGGVRHLARAIVGFAGWAHIGKDDSGLHTLVEPITAPAAGRAERLAAYSSAPDGSAFDAFFTQHEHALYGYLRRMVPSNDIALDLAQETFLRAWRHFAIVSAYERPAAWLYRAATNLAISHLRRRHVLPFTQFASHLHGVEGAPSAIPDQELFADPTDFTAQTAERDLINRVLLRLPARQRAALLLRAVHGLSGDEIAQALGMSGPAARQTLSRGRERFRALYEEAAQADDSSTSSHRIG